MRTPNVVDHRSRHRVLCLPRVTSNPTMFILASERGVIRQHHGGGEVTMHSIVVLSCYEYQCPLPRVFESTLSLIAALWVCIIINLSVLPSFTIGFLSQQINGTHSCIPWLPISKKGSKTLRIVRMSSEIFRMVRVTAFEFAQDVLYWQPFMHLYNLCTRWVIGRVFVTQMAKLWHIRCSCPFLERRRRWSGIAIPVLEASRYLLFAANVRWISTTRPIQWWPQTWTVSQSSTLYVDRYRLVNVLYTFD